jgi:hypothetical protein
LSGPRCKVCLPIVAPERLGTVITQDLERLSRDPLSLIAVLESFLEDGVNVEFSTEEGKAVQLEELEHSR